MNLQKELRNKKPNFYINDHFSGHHVSIVHQIIVIKDRSFVLTYKAFLVINKINLLENGWYIVPMHHS